MSRKREVLVCCHEESLGGATIAVARIADRMAELGFDLRFWAPKPSRLAGELADMGHEVGGAPRPIAYSRVALAQPPGTVRRLRGLPGYRRAFLESLGARPPAIVHANTLYSLAEGLTARRAGIPAVLHLHEMLPDSAKGRLGARMAFAGVDEVMAVSAACAAAFTSGGRQPSLVPNGVEVPAEPLRVAGTGGIRVGSIGVVSRRKGTDLFVAAAEIASREHPGLEFELIGARTDVLDRAWGAGVIERARAVGVTYREQDRADLALGRWDIVVMPSRKDPFPLVVLEAMAAGRPVIGAASDGIREQLAGGAGVLVPPEDPAALAAAIGRLAADPAARARLGAAARERVSEHFTLGRQASRTAAVYERALARPV